MDDDYQEALWEPADATRAASILKQLEQELSPGHLLHGKVVKVVGVRIDQDDVLLYLPETNEWAFCHLTYQGQQQPPWPRTTVFRSEHG